MSFLSKFQVLPGGADINPSLYGMPVYGARGWSDEVDKRHIELYKKAVKEKRPIFGICRGMQLISALNGLTLIQDMSHNPNHLITARNLETEKFDLSFRVNQAHHQCVWTENKLEDENYIVYGYANISPHHKYSSTKQIECVIEPEIMYFPKVNALCTQFHPRNLG